MSNKELPEPTEMELEILQVLWDHGSLRVREVAEHLSERRASEVGYTTALKLLQIMHQKGLVVRDESQRSHVYAARTSRKETESGVLKRLADRLFGGAMGAVALHALSSESISRSEIEEVRDLLDQLETETDTPRKPS